MSQSITRRSASNLALAFVMLPREKRHAMAALYAFCRQVDDVADELSTPSETRRAHLEAWRADLRGVFDHRPSRFPVLQELAPVIARYRLPWELFDDLLRGVEMDLDVQRYPDYAALDLYCYRVASVVGLLSIEIFGYRQPASREYAVALGHALQLTNILRDVGTDAERGRIYLPLDQLARFEVAEADVLRHAYSPQFRDLAASVAARARGFYQRARQTLPAEDRRAMVAAELMGAVYWRLLRTLEARAFRVFEPPPIRVSRARKAALILRTWFRFSVGSAASGYGVA